MANRLHLREPRPAPLPEAVTDPDVLAGYLVDAARYPGGTARTLYRPRDEPQLAAVLRATAPAPVLAQGARSSLTGGATPRDDLVVSLSHLRGEPRLDARGRVTVGAGVTVAELNAWLRARGREYPPVPTFEGATAGGVVATNAAGAATFRYGTTREWVEALRVVLADGTLLVMQRGEVTADARGGFTLVWPDGRTRDVPGLTYVMAPVRKQSAGYFSAPGMDAVDLVAGSEGTLGIVTEVTLRTIARPVALLAGLVIAPDEARAIALCAALRDGKDLGLRAVEHMDAACLALLREDGQDRAQRIPLTLPDGPPDPAPVALLFEVELEHAMGEAAVLAAVAAAWAGQSVPGSARLARLLVLLRAHDALERLVHVAPPGDDAALARLHHLREAVPAGVNARVAAAQRALGPAVSKLAADMVVPFERFAEMQAAYHATLRAAGLRYAIWGHISDGNVHPNVLPARVEDMAAGHTAFRALGRVATSLGGCPLGEHGVGRNPLKQVLLADHLGEAAIAQMRAVKAAFDPDWRLARGVLFPPP